MDENINKVTIEELLENPPVIDRKFILIDSTLYTDEAYEHLLDLINETDSIAFIRDLKKIYTHGEYFGGDIWEDSLFYFGDFEILDNDSEEVLTTIKAEAQKESLRLKGENHLLLLPEEHWVNGFKYKTLRFKWDIDNSIDTSVFKIDDSTAEYNLEIKDNKIAVNKYIPIRIVPSELEVIEYDSNPSIINFNLDIYGTEPEINVFVTSTNSGSVITLSEDKRTVNCQIGTKNENIDYLVVYSDSKTDGLVHNYLKYGFGNAYSNSEITANNFLNTDRFISEDSCTCEFDLNIDDEEYGWFACPIAFNPKFIDKDTNISGGWIKSGVIKVYSLNLEYTVYRTENSGLGNTSWKIIE